MVPEPVKRKKMPPPSALAPQAEPEAPVGGDGSRFSVIAGKMDKPQRTVVFGPGGIGKSTLCSLAPSAVFIDIEGGTNDMDVPRIEGVNSFADLRACLQSNALDDYKTIILDTATKAEEWALEHTLKTVPHEKGAFVKSIEGYGFGKGLQHLFDTFLLLLSDLDSQVRRGRNVILIAHDCISDVPNPVGENFIRYEPHLQSPKSGKASIRNRVIQWADHVLFVSYDVISKDGKGQGGGTRTIYTSELPSHIAKSRRVDMTIPFSSPEDGTIWEHIIGGTR